MEDIIKKLNWLGFNNIKEDIWEIYKLIRYYFPEYDLCVYRSKDKEGYLTDVDNYELDAKEVFKKFWNQDKLYISINYDDAWIKGFDLILTDIMSKDFVPIPRRCPHCGKVVVVKIPKEEWIKWDSGNGGLIQNCLVSLTPDERELLISGICPECWKSIFSGDEVEC